MAVFPRWTIIAPTRNWMNAMQTFEPPFSHYLWAAIGWLELGTPAEARAELAKLAPSWQNHPATLEVRWAIAAHEKNWDEALQLAREMIRRAPERSSGLLHQAYALRRVAGGSVEQAWDALLPANEKFPKEPVIPYNLSCYACQMRRLVEARDWFRRAIKVGSKENIKQMALNDEDLKPLWEEIRQL